MFYVYILKDPRTNLPFYVGKGKNNRAYDHIKKNLQGKNTENPYKDHVVRQILAEGLMPIIEYVYKTDDEADAYNYETTLIKKYGRRRYDEHGILTNLCEDNRPPHDNYSEERRQKYRNNMLGNKINLGRKQSDDEKRKRSESLKRAYDTGKRKMSDETKAILSRTHKGKVVSEETRDKMKKSAKAAKANWKCKTITEILGLEKAANKAAKLSALPPPNRKPVSIDGIIYDSIRSAAIALGISEYKAKKLNDFKS